MKPRPSAASGSSVKETQPLERDFSETDERPIWAITDIVKDVPDEVIDRLPTDGGSQVDRYIYGLPRSLLGLLLSIAKTQRI